MSARKFFSEADFVSNFLLPELRGYATSYRLDVELHIEEPAGKGRADLTVRKDGKKMLVIEAKLEKDPWHPDVVREGLSYSLTGFPFFTVCNPAVLILFKSDPDAFRSALGALYFDQLWVDQLFKLMANPPDPRSLYEMVYNEGLIDRETMRMYEEVNELEAGEAAKNSEPPTFRLIAIAGPSGQFPRSMGKTWTLENALENKSVYESNGFKIKVQERVNGSWRDIDTVQGKL